MCKRTLLIEISQHERVSVQCYPSLNVSCELALSKAIQFNNPWILLLRVAEATEALKEVVKTQENRNLLPYFAKDRRTHLMSSYKCKRVNMRNLIEPRDNEQISRKQSNVLL